MKSNIVLKLSALFFLLMGIMPVLLAQGPPAGGGGTSTNGPIDGGAVALLAGSAYYGYKRLKNKQRNNSEA